MTRTGAAESDRADGPGLAAGHGGLAIPALAVAASLVFRFWYASFRPLLPDEA